MWWRIILGNHGSSGELMRMCHIFEITRSRTISGQMSRWIWLEIMNIILHVSCGQKFLVSLSSGFHKGNPVVGEEREVTVVDTIF